MDSILIATAYFPPIEYFAYLAKAELAKIEVHETYAKQTYRNRCHIYSPNGVQALSIPIHKTNGNHTKTIDIKISEHYDWKSHHWKSIKTAYNASAFFMYYENELLEAINFFSLNLVEYNTHLLNFILNEIGLHSDINFTNEFIKEAENIVDLRMDLSPKINKPHYEEARYYQVFEEKHGFMSNLSILDLLFNEGPNTLNYLQSLLKI
jgi:hypothetical protein